MQLGQEYHIQTDHNMGLDHGAWTVLKYLYPKADVPVFQLSIDYTKPPSYHYELAGALAALRQKGVLIIGSGNIVHNLRNLDWHHIDATPFDWAVEFDEVDHYLPMLYTLGIATKGERVEQLYEGMQYGSISMRCFKIG